MRAPWVVWAAAAVVACGSGFVNMETPARPSQRFEVTTTGTLFASDRGYRVAVLPATTARVIRLDVRYPVGAANDPPGKAGLAHLVEHLLFSLEYTHGDRKTSIANELGRVSLGWNAETTADFTDYQTLVLPA